MLRRQIDRVRDAARRGGYSPRVKYEHEGFMLAVSPVLESEFQSGIAGDGSAAMVAIRPVVQGGTNFFGVHSDLKWGVVDGGGRFRYAPGEIPLNQASVTGGLEQVSATTGYVALGGQNALVQVGKIGVGWGVGASGQLLLSHGSGGRDGFRLLLKYGRLRFESVTFGAPSAGIEKYVSAHRLAVRVHPRLSIGVYEAVTYTNRIELAYANPFAVYLMAIPIVERARESPSRPRLSRDNGFLGGDIMYRAGERTLLYADLMVDDFQPQELSGGFRAWDTKFAVQLGVFAVEPLGLEDVAARFEYTFVNQYAYTHEVPGLEYTSRGSPIGFHTGPDADDFRVEAAHWLRPWARVSLTGRVIREGGQGIEIPHSVDDSVTWDYVSGVRETRRTLAARVEVTDLRRRRLAVEFRAGDLQNRGNVPSGAESIREAEVSLTYAL